jgi:hypothetical protein
VFESFAAIQCFAVLYLLYYVFLREDFVETEVDRRVGHAISRAIEIDEWRPRALLAIAGLYGVGILAFSWANVARGWAFPTYSLLLLHILSEVLAELSSST